MMRSFFIFMTNVLHLITGMCVMNSFYILPFRYRFFVEENTNCIFFLSIQA
ncbi:hypothetical protein Hanom_Chr02g00142661 [Helianthus anomalus]